MLARWTYRTFRFAHALGAMLERRLTPGGRLVLAAAVGAAMLGPNTRVTVAYQIFTFLVALLGVAILAAIPLPPGLVLRRRLPRFATVGEPLVYRVDVLNPTPRLQRGIRLFEALDDPRPTLAEFTTEREPGEERRNAFDRVVGYPRWAWLVEQRRRGRVAPQALPPLGPGARVEVRVPLEPRHRGRLRFTELVVARSDPLGLVNSLVSVPAPGTLLVLPRRYPVPAVALPGRRRYQHGGVTLASSVGDSEEFASLRDYRPGDPLRRVHWRSWARAGRPIVREYQDEFFVRHALVLDTFARTATPAFEEAVSVAASFAATVGTQESLLDLLFVGAEAHAVTAGRGVGHVDRMLEILASVAPCTTHAFDVLERHVLGRATALSGCLCVLLGWDAERRRLVTGLRAAGIPTLPLVVVEPGAPALPAGAGAHRLEVGRVAEGLARL